MGWFGMTSTPQHRQLFPWLDHSFGSIALWSFLVTNVHAHTMNDVRVCERRLRVSIGAESTRRALHLPEATLHDSFGSNKSLDVILYVLTYEKDV